MSGATPFPFQVEGAEFLASMDKAVLADEMGLGKTCQAIIAADKVKAQRILVVCPAMLRGNWAREFGIWSKTPRDIFAALPVQNGQKKRSDERKRRIATAEVVILSYEMITSPTVFKEVCDADKFDLLIVDEAHYLKNPNAKRTKRVLGDFQRPGKPSAAARCSRQWFLTGTPMPNTPDELYPLMHFCGVFDGTFAAFRNRYCVGYPTEWGFKVTGVQRSAELKKHLGTILLRRTKRQVMKQLPPISWTLMLVEENTNLPNLGLDRYPSHQLEEGYRRRWAECFDPETGEIHGLDNDPGMATLRRHAGMRKLRAVVEMVDELLAAAPNEKLVLFGYHRDVLQYLAATLSKDYGAEVIMGGVPVKVRDSIINKFQTHLGKRVLVCQINAAGVGLTLTAARNVWIVEPSWVPAENAQAAMRCHRIGQTMPVEVRFIGLARSIDEEITEALRRKTAISAQLFRKL
jgi:SWI/SNF-related matrix-associated actin-dependent regulator of chromatin subfamily A-like protein 1